MANKYIIEGSTYNGDGTTSAEAASAGAAGAWNHVNILTGTAISYGSLNAGDVVYIRSKTAAGADITITASSGNVAIGRTGTAADYITFVLDKGDIWSGINGVLTFTTSNTSYNFSTVNYCRIIAAQQDSIVVQSTATTAASSTLLSIVTSVIENIKIIMPTSSNVGYSIRQGYGVTSTLINPHVIAAKYAPLFVCSEIGGGGNLTIINPNIELTALVTAYGVFGVPSYPSRFRIIGGKISGAGATTGASLFLASTTYSQPEIIGLYYPSVVGFGASNSRDVATFGSDSYCGTFVQTLSAKLDSRLDGNYPTLNAVLPDSVSTPWSWKVYPNGASLSSPADIIISSLWTGSASVVTFTIEVLLAHTFNLLTTNIYWAEFCYIDNATGEHKMVSTNIVEPSALTSSSASWSALTWGAVSLDPYKFVATSNTAIKTDSQVTVRFCTAEASANGDDILFICPAVQIS